jgi:hypothetical protein
MKRIILVAMVVALVAVSLAASALSVKAQGYGQYASTSGQNPICAPWSRAWDIAQGKWWFQSYRWCYDPTTSDPSYEGSWYMEQGNWQWGDPVNLCSESGNCTVTPTGRGGKGVLMSTNTTIPVVNTQTYTDSSSNTTSPVSTQTPSTS